MLMILEAWNNFHGRAPPLLTTNCHFHEFTHANEAIFYTPPDGDVSTTYDVSRDLFDDNFQ